MLAEESAMVSLLMESIVISFALGGVVGAVIAIQLLFRKKEIHAFSAQDDNVMENRPLLRREVEARIKVPPRR